MLREARDMEPKGSKAFQLYDELIATEIESRAKEVQAKELARQSKETELIHYRRAALIQGPTRSQKFKWWLSDHFAWLGVVPAVLIENADTIIIVSAIVSTLAAFIRALTLESGPAFWLYLLPAAVLFVIALFVGDSATRKHAAVFDLICACAFVGMALVPYKYGFFGSGPGYYAIVVRDHGQVVRAERVSSKQWVRAPKLSQEFEWYDLRASTFGFTGQFDHGRGYVNMRYDYRIKFDALAAGYKPDDAEIKRIGNELYNQVFPILESAKTLDDLKQIPKVINSIHSPVFSIYNAHVVNAGYDLSKEQ